MGNIIEGATDGNLVILDSWPGQMRTVHGDHDRFEQTYFLRLKACTSPVMALVDEDGYYFRLLVVLMTCWTYLGHRMGTAEIESALVAFADKIAEAAIVGIPTTSAKRFTLTSRLMMTVPNRRAS